jgi:cell division protein FtsA
MLNWFRAARHIIVGLEVGTSKVVAVVGELSPQGALSIIGVGQARSRGVRKGEIVDPTAAAEDIRAAIVAAEKLADEEVRAVYLGVTGGHLRGFNNRGHHPIPSVDREITAEDVQDVVNIARTINLPADNHVLHMVRQHYIVDGQTGIQNPVGMVGAQLQVDVHITHGLRNRMQNAVRTVRTLQLEVEELVFSGIASSLAVLETQDKELGTLVVDLGAGATEYVVYADGIVKHTGVLAVGGDHVTNDLAYGLKVSMSRAEELKVEHGSAVVEPAVRGRTLSLASDRGLPERSLNLEHLHRIMSLRLEEVFEIIAEELDRAGLLAYLRNGVVLCGGGAHIPGIERLAGRVFDLPVVIGRTKAISGLASTLDQPEFATAIGLVKYGSFQAASGRKRAPWFDRVRMSLSQMLSSFLSF